MTSEEFRSNPMFLRNQFTADGVFEIPRIEKEDIDLEKVALIGYDKLNENKIERIVHFFLDDYKFEVMWNDPEPRVERLQKYKAVLAPNFSIYTEMPLSMKIYNTFRSRWCGAFLQSRGIKVIPTVSWGEPNTFWFCFDGIPKGSVVAVSTLGVRTEKSLFMQGYDEMLRKIKPSTVICYGKPFDEMKGKIIEVDYARTNHYAKSQYGEKPISIGLSTFDETTGVYVKKICGFVCSGKGMGSAGRLESLTEQNSKTPMRKKNELPENVQKSYDKYNENNWQGNVKGQSDGTKAGGRWNNRPQQLPQTDKNGRSISYREFDVNNREYGNLRSSERFVRGSDGSTYYTPDHYDTFYKIID